MGPGQVWAWYVLETAGTTGHLRLTSDLACAQFFSSFLHRVMMVSGFPGGSEGKAFACNAGDPGSIPGWEDPLEKRMAAHTVFLPRKSLGQRSLVGYSPLGHRVGHD